MAYQIANEPGPWGVSVDQQLQTTATLNTSFDNNGWQEALQNTCMMKPAQNLPVWPKALHTYSRPALDKPAQPLPSAQIALKYGRPFLPDESAPDSGLFVSTADMKPVDVSYRSQVKATLPAGVPGPNPMALAPPAMAAPPRPMAPILCNDCSLSCANFKVKNIPSCMWKSVKGLFETFTHWKSAQGNSFGEKMQHAWMDNSRLFYMIIWLVLVIAIVLFVKSRV